MAENPVSCWESSSSSDNSNRNSDGSASTTASTSTNNNNGSNSGNDNNYTSDNNTSSSSDSWKSHPWPADNTNRDIQTEDEEEVIFELDEEAMAQLPVHLQRNMRQIQRERLERIRRENVQVPVRKHSDDKDRADEWFRRLMARLPPPPPPPPRAVGLGLGSRRGGYERDVSPSPRGRRNRSRPPMHLQSSNVHQKTKGNNDPEHNKHKHKHVRGREVDHVHAASNKDSFYSTESNGPRRSEPYLPDSEDTMGQYYIGHGEIYEGQQDEYSQARKKRADMRGRMKRSIRKMSRVFRKGGD